MEEIENCLLCYTKCDDWILLNSEKAIDLNMKDILLKHFWLQLQDIDLSKAICTICWQSINNFHEFYVRIESIHKSHNKLITIIHAGSGDSKKTTDIIDLPIDVPNISIKGEASMTIREEVYITESEDIKNEQSNSVSDYDDFNDDIDDEEDYNDNDDNMEIVPELPLSLRTRKRNISPVAKQRKQPKTPKKRIRKKKPAIKPDYTEQNLKLNRYCHMECDLCSEKLKGYIECKQHYREIHNKKGYIKCCGIKYWVLSRLMQHCEWHENPEAFKCETCQKCYTDKFKLKLHLEKSHTPSNQRHFKCDLCVKSYTRLSVLLYHKKVSHPKEEDKRYECDVCGVKFVVKAFLRFHIKRVHEDSDSRMCDICARYFKCAKSYDHHYLVHHTNIQLKVQCDICGVWLKHQASLNYHIRRQHSVFELETCDICGKTCPNKKSLYAHKYRKHIFREYPCTICNKPFKKKQTLREHMALHTGEKDLYKCSYCSRTFRSNANMYAHRKRAHPKEYKENMLLGKKFD